MSEDMVKGNPDDYLKVEEEMNILANLAEKLMPGLGYIILAFDTVKGKGGIGGYMSNMNSEGVAEYLRSTADMIEKENYG